MSKVTLRRKARQFGRLIRHSAMTPRTGISSKPLKAGSHELGVTFIGHSSFLLQLGSRNVIVDPNYARWIFVLKRLRRPGIRIPDLPPIDTVLVSHAHFDHLHRPSLRAIVRHNLRNYARRPAIVVPKHVGDLVCDLGFSAVIELEWWEETHFGNMHIAHVPARHWGARIIRDMHRGYGGFVLRDHRHSIYHAGDTAYFSGFREIGERLHPQVALLPIGAYDPESFRKVHASPEDALQGFVDMGARWMIPMHYGPFRLSHEPLDEPLRRLLSEASRRGLASRIAVLQEGGTRIF